MYLVEELNEAKGGGSCGIHSTAIVSPSAVLGEAVSVGPFAIIEAGVNIGPGSKINSHAVIKEGTILGQSVAVDSFAVVGGDPQVTGFDGSIKSGVIIGDFTVIREGVTVHRSKEPGKVTQVGVHVMLMANSHIGHDARVGDRTILANGVLLGGYSDIGNSCFLGGNAAVHQYIRIGSYSMIGGVSAITIDIPPFSTAVGRNQLIGLNLEGLKRQQFPRDSIADLKVCFRRLYESEGNIYKKAEKAMEEGLATSELAIQFLFFFKQKAKKGIASSLRVKK